MGLEEWGCQLTTRKGESGVPKWGPFGCSKWVLPIVYLHAGLEIGSAIPYAIHQESNRDSHALVPKISMSLGVVTIPIGSTNAKMAKLPTLTLG